MPIQKRCADYERTTHLRYVIDGSFEVPVGAKALPIKTDEFAFGPRNVAHHFRNVGDAPGRILLMFTPGGVENFFREAGQPATNDGPAPQVDAAEIARMQVAAKHGVLRP